MASSGWQGEKTIYTRNSNIHYIANVNISSITRNTNNVVVSGKIRFGARGTSGYSSYYVYGVDARPSGGSWATILGDNVNISNGSNKDIDFSTTISVSSSATSATLTLNYRACYNSSCSSTYWSASPSWTITFSSSGSAPSGVSVAYNSSTWDTITATSTLTSWGGLTGVIQGIVITGSSADDAANATADNWTSMGRHVYSYNVPNTSTLSHQFAMSMAATHTDYNTPIDIKGMRHYKLAAWASNSAGNARAFDNTLRYTPPAPGFLSYRDNGGDSDKTYTIKYVGDTSTNNSSGYEQAYLTRTVRYKIGSGSWVYVDNATVAVVGLETTASITLHPGESATVECWMTYHGMQSQVSRVTINNTNLGYRLYGSVNGQTKKLGPVYASVNGRSKKLVRIYASVDGVARKVYEDGE